MPNFGFKGTDDDMMCKGTQYKLGETFKFGGDMKICKSGFHFCKHLRDVHEYYPFECGRVFIIEYGENVKTEEDKSVSDQITFLEELSGNTLMQLLESPEYGSLLNENANGLLLMASFSGHVDVVKYLVDHGAYIPADNHSAIREASSSGHLEVVKYFVDHGANIHAHNDSAVVMAFLKQHLDIVEYLVAHGATVDG